MYGTVRSSWAVQREDIADLWRAVAFARMKKHGLHDPRTRQAFTNARIIGANRL